MTFGSITIYDYFNTGSYIFVWKLHFFGNFESKLAWAIKICKVTLTPVKSSAFYQHLESYPTIKILVKCVSPKNKKMPKHEKHARYIILVSKVEEDPQLYAIINRVFKVGRER